MYGSSFPPRMGRGGMGPPGRPMGRMEMGMVGGMGRMDHGIDHGIDPNVGNVTNDPHSIHCRVFVGNLNTHLMLKEDLERIFCNYGHITGISMHKGYAFVQYSNPGDARRAAILEDGKVYANMRLDANVASEPKHGSGRGHKRPGGPVSSRPGGPGPGNPSWQGSGPVKKPRVEIQTNPSMKRTLVTISSSSSPAVKRPFPARATKPSVTAAKQIEATKSLNTSSGDILICGRCRAMFPNVHRLAMHKKIQCVVKTNCKCQSVDEADLEPSPLSCASCALSFLNAWDLVQHCQAEHSLAIYKSTSSKTAQQKQDEEKEKPETKSDPADDLNGSDEVQIDEAAEDALLKEEPTESGDN